MTEPFKYGKPITGKYFVNREDELRELRTLVDSIKEGAEVNITLSGLRRTGKTELFLEFGRTNRNNRVIIPYLNLQKILPDALSFSKRFSDMLLLSLKKEPEEKSMEPEDLLILATELGGGGEGLPWRPDKHIRPEGDGLLLICRRNT